MKTCRWIRYSAILIIGGLLLLHLSAMDSLSLPPIGADVLISRIKDNESLPTSGMADEVIDTLRDLPSTKYAYAFRGRKSLYYKIVDSATLPKCVFRYDGRISAGYVDGQDMGGVNYCNEAPLGGEMDPRSWGIYHADMPLSEYLEKYGVRNIKTESLDGVPCYVVETSDWINTENKIYFWISPDQGFRYLQCKIFGRTSITNYPNLSQMSQLRDGTFDTGQRVPSIELEKVKLREYKIGGKSVWFVEKGKRETISEKEPEKILNYSTIEVRNFQPNADVSKFFDPGTPPDFPKLYDPKQPITPFKEFGWNPYGDFFSDTPEISYSQLSPASIDAGKLIDNLKHNESMLATGMADVAFYSYSKENPAFHFVFAFRGDKSVHYSYISDIWWKERQIYYDGKTELSILETEYGELIIEAKPSDTFSMVYYELDPRNWGTRYCNIPLSVYLDKNGILDIRQEKLNGDLCYVVESGSSVDPDYKVRFWLSPALGYNCVKSEEELRWGKPDNSFTCLNTKQFTYKKYAVGNKSYRFINRGSAVVTPISNRNYILTSYSMEVKDFQPNADTDSLFDPGLLPEHKVTDLNSQSWRLFKDYTWNP